MSETLFNVILHGVAEGVDPQQAQSDFAALFSLDADKVARLFAAKRAVLKSSVDETVANKYINRLAKMGVIAIAEAIISEPVAEPIVAAASPVESDEAEPLEQDQDASQEQDTFAAEPTDVTYRREEPHTDAEPASPLIDDEPQSLTFRFTGNGFEYFKIWIVNILLTIVTLGIYSAWAKVRNKQYFYGNTHIGDATFEYTADPKKILRGRLIAFGLFFGYSLLSKTAPLVGLLLALVLMFATPWIIVTSLRFNARYSSYRHIAFRFTGRVGEAAKVFILWPLIGIFSFGILLPFAWRRQAQFVTNNHAYGTSPFHFDVSVKEYYKIILVSIGVLISYAVIVAILLGGTAGMIALMKPGQAGTMGVASIVALAISYLALYLFLGAYFMVSMANIHFNHSRILGADSRDVGHFSSNWSVLSYAWLFLSNTIGILFTLGLFIPFAKVRTATYKADHTQLALVGSLENFIANEQEQSSALGEGMHDMFDIDISL